ncbi:MAG: PQQ-binding-like beta-propeller repeat protein, partial [candidate division Zixibacteria bacterium]|nr:PQQ-binding-like beta-propeller repeat protein [candidate division Zixibacteria bacterium]
TEYSFTDAAWGGDGQIIGGNTRCTPTVATVTVAGQPTAVLFLTGGASGSVSAFDLSLNFTAAPTLLWSANINNGWLGHTAGMGATRFYYIIVMTVGSDECVFWAADDNLVYAAYAATGLPYTPFKGGNASYTPFNLGQSSQKSGCTDGTFLFYTTFNAGGAGGKVIAINPATGNQAWSYTADKAPVLFPGNLLETFEGGCSVDAGEVYANSRIFDGTRRGVFYRLNAITGALLSSTAGDRARLMTPILDKKLAFVPVLPSYTGLGPIGGNVAAHARNDGSLVFAAHSYQSYMLANGQVGNRVDGALSCEPDSSDQLFVFNTSGYLSCYKADDGNELFHRRVDHGGAAGFPGGSASSNPAPSEGGMGAIGKDAAGNPHVVFVDVYGGIYDQTIGNPRPRLEILMNSPVTAVPFQSSADTIVTFPNVYTNTGCTPLIISFTASMTSNGTTNPVANGGSSAISSRLESNSASLADMLSGNGFMVYETESGIKSANRDLFGGDVDNISDMQFASVRQSYNNSAAALPAYLNQNPGSYPGDVFDPPNGNIVTNPGDTSGIRVHANGPLVNRGPNPFYCEFTVINDVDYYLDDPARRPELYMNLIGGCLDDTTTLKFGAASANQRLVTNTTRIATGDWSDGPAGHHGVKIDGLIEITYQTFSAYGINERRQAWNSQGWHGGGEDGSWWSTLGDPNFCDNKCKPTLSTGLDLGQFSTDGLTYSTITGSRACRTYIDSVQNFDDGLGGWDYTLYKDAPFDNDSTIGMTTTSKVYAVVDAPAGATVLNNVTLDVMEIKHRTGLAVPGWKMWAYNDNDLGSKDTAYYDQAHSVGWAAVTPTPALGKVSGFMKIPFGPGYTPLRNVTACSQNTISFIDDWDSAWFYTSKPYGQYVNSQAGAADYGALFGLDWHDFAAGETYKVGVGFFAFKDLDSSNCSTCGSAKISKLATLVNKWAGFGRGDVNDDGVVNLVDIIYLADHINFATAGPRPFKHLGDVNNSTGAPDVADVTYLVNFYFSYGPAPVGAFILP